MSAPESDSRPPTPAPLEQQPARVKTVSARSQTLIAWLALALVLVIAVVGTSPFWAADLGPVLPWGHQIAATKTDRSALDALEQRVRANEAALKRQAAQLQRLTAIEQELKNDATRLTRLESRPVAIPVPPLMPSAPAASPAADDVKALDAQLAKLAADEAAADRRISGLEGKLGDAAKANRADHARLLALANLRIAVEGAKPFVAELDAAQALAADQANEKAALASLAVAAKSGLPSRAMLAERFDRQVAAAILRAPRDIPEDDWWGRIRARVERLVVVRRISPDGSAPRNGVEGAVANADDALRHGDLAAAVTALNGLSGDAATVAAPWIRDAKARIDAEATLEKVWRGEVARAGEKS